MVFVMGTNVILYLLGCECVRVVFVGLFGLLPFSLLNIIRRSSPAFSRKKKKTLYAVVLRADIICCHARLTCSSLNTTHAPYALGLCGGGEVPHGTQCFVTIVNECINKLGKSMLQENVMRRILCPLI